MFFVPASIALLAVYVYLGLVELNTMSVYEISRFVDLIFFSHFPTLTV